MTKRMICGLLAVLMLLGMVGCASGGGNGPEPVVTVQPSGDVTEPTRETTEPAGNGGAADPAGDVTEPAEGVTDPAGDVTEPAGNVTEPDVTDPTGDDVTGPTEAAPSEPGTDVTEPDVTEPTENGGIELPPVPTDPVVTEPVSPKPPVTEVPEDPTEAPTKPAPTDPPATKPAPTDPPATKHVHDYSTKVVKPTCEEKGYTKYTCECGDSYKDNYTPAGEHDYKAGEVVEATMWKGGYTKYICNHCGDTCKKDKTDKVSEEEFCRMVAEAALKYINQFRVEQGDTEAEMLPGLTQIAEDRAVQLIDKFEHNSTKLRELHNKYQYGEYVDVSDWGDGYENYWTSNGPEAIGRRGSIGYLDGSADDIGRAFASGLRNSAGHWAYVGDSKFPYMGVGVSYADGWWYICTLQTRDNYG